MTIASPYKLLSPPAPQPRAHLVHLHSLAGTNLTVRVLGYGATQCPVLTVRMVLCDAVVHGAMRYPYHDCVVSGTDGAYGATRSARLYVVPSGL
eukprot:2111855-Rhodomonas_salina.7